MIIFSCVEYEKNITHIMYLLIFGIISIAVYIIAVIYLSIRCFARNDKDRYIYTLFVITVTDAGVGLSMSIGSIAYNGNNDTIKKYLFIVGSILIIIGKSICLIYLCCNETNEKTTNESASTKAAVVLTTGININLSPEICV